jgi:hypothetical protein
MGWQPPAAAWMVAHNRLMALSGLEVEDKLRLLPKNRAPASAYPSNALVVASLQPRPPRRRHPR